MHIQNPRLLSLIACGLLIGTWTSAAHADHEQRIARLQKLLDRLPHAQTVVSAAVMSLPDGKMIYERNADRVLIPASNQKIIPGAVALAKLGVAHSFDTRLALDGDDLILIGGGDPSLGDSKLADERGGRSTDVFEQWASILTQRGITTIKGDIVVEDQIFEQPWVHPSWEESDLTKWYAAPVGGLNFNDNCIEITLRPTTPGQLVRFEVFPPSAWIRIDNRCKTASKNKPWIHRPSSAPLYQLRGRCNRKSELKSVSVPDPGIFTGEVLKAVLKSHGIDVRGEVRRAAPVPQTHATNSHGREILAVHSTPLADVLRRALGDSQNLFAECLIKSLSVRPASDGRPGKAGSWQAGGAVALETIRGWGIDTSGMVIADGSGLSRDNRASARQIVQILRHVYMDSDGGSLFMDSLSLNATRGTLRKRMKDIPGRVMAKTGYMRGVRSLSGYVRASPKAWYAFSVLFNEIPGGTAPYNRIHDDVCRTLVGPKSVAAE
ncbi:MAG: D-alanyl-D-alanine carboxypeptidase/D-alanyl-D-alanine-endopeptidase [Planctomycetes bacterium]|nr:D-alanyl-D-alanine carboxypeptidase/D-alanyl-D-alanine-endopeptidase [Planctomycetota bacterium]